VEETHAPKINMGGGWANGTRDRGPPSRNTSQKENGLRRVNHCIKVSNRPSDASDGEIYIEDTEARIECQSLKVIPVTVKIAGSLFQLR
jgi:hypothetical protein